MSAFKIKVHYQKDHKLQPSRNSTAIGDPGNACILANVLEMHWPKYGPHYIYLPLNKRTPQLKIDTDP